MNKINKLISLLCIWPCCSLFYSNAMESRKQSDEKIIPFDKLKPLNSPINLNTSNSLSYKPNFSLSIKIHDLNEKNIEVNTSELSISIPNNNSEFVSKLEKSNFSDKIVCKNNILSFHYKTNEDFNQACMKVNISLKNPRLIYHKIIESNNNAFVNSLDSNNNIGYCHQSNSESDD